jgi:hypothetical protein
MTSVRTIIHLEFTEATLAGLQAVFIERLDHGLGIAEIRRRVGNAAAGATRVLKPEHERQSLLRQWAMTVVAIGKIEEVVVHDLMAQLKGRGHPDRPPAMATDGKGDYRIALVETWGQVPA